MHSTLMLVPLPLCVLCIGVGGLFKGTFWKEAAVLYLSSERQKLKWTSDFPSPGWDPGSRLCSRKIHNAYSAGYMNTKTHILTHNQRHMIVCTRVAAADTKRSWVTIGRWLAGCHLSPHTHTHTVCMGGQSPLRTRSFSAGEQVWAYEWNSS